MKKTTTASRTRGPREAEGNEPFALTDEMLESVSGGIGYPSPSKGPFVPQPLSVHNWDGHPLHI